jgi:hypothetical protein
MLRAPLWVAAGRARQPHGELAGLTRLPGVANIPDAIHESRVELLPNKPGVSRWDMRAHATPLRLDAAFDADIASKVSDFPHCGFYPRKEQRRYVDWFSAWILDWRSQIWPANARGLVISGVNHMLQRFDMNSSVYEPNYMFIEAIRHLAKPLGGVEALALGIGSMSGEQEVRRSTAEVLARAAIEGRIGSESLCAALLELHAKQWFSIGRLGSTLGAVAADSPHGAHLVVATISKFLGTFDALPKGSHDLLEILHQQAHRLGISVDPVVIARLQAHVNAKTKTGRLAQQLVALKPEPGRSSVANAEALERLVAAAESTSR